MLSPDPEYSQLEEPANGLPAVDSWCWWPELGTWSSRARSSKNLSRWSSESDRAGEYSGQNHRSGTDLRAPPAHSAEQNAMNINTDSVYFDNANTCLCVYYEHDSLIVMVMSLAISEAR